MAAAPAAAHTINSTLINEKGFDTGENLYPYLGLGLCLNSCYVKYPECLGAVCEVTCCCVSSDVLACKPSPGNPDHCCTLLRAQIDCVKVTVCIKSRSQLCCLDFRAAMPPDNEVPCALNVFGLTCCFANAATCRCCTTLASLQAASPNK